MTDRFLRLDDPFDRLVLLSLEGLQVAVRFRELLVELEERLDKIGQGLDKIQEIAQEMKQGEADGC